VAFDSGMLAAVVKEIGDRALGARVDKIQKPAQDEVVFLLHTQAGSLRLSIIGGGGNPKIGFTNIAKENPAVPPMFCVLLRKHLSGARLLSVSQLGFERAAELKFSARDEMGFISEKYLIAEIIGKYSNIILLDSDKKIIAALRPVDFTTSSRRQVLPGMAYEMPPPQDKKNPLYEDFSGFETLFKKASPEASAAKFILENYMGISSLVAREIVYRVTRHIDSPLFECGAERLWAEFLPIIETIKAGDFTPVLISDESGAPLEFCFTDISQYEGSATVRVCSDFCELLDLFFAGRENIHRIRQRASDITRLLSNAQARLTKKLSLQRAELEECAECEKYKRWGDIITANLHILNKGMRSARVVDYYSDNLDMVEITLDERLTPAQNAQKMYKKYSKAKSAQINLERQMALAEGELEYINGIADSVLRTESESDLCEIRAELHSSGYASKMKNYTSAKAASPKPAEFRTDGGYRVLCGKNNTQNDYITFKLASKSDLWFHAKNTPGSHAVMLCGDEEPSALDYTQAAQIAAYYSKAADSGLAAVDYTRIKNVKKPPGAKPGFVTYAANHTAYVKPDSDTVMRLKVNPR